MNSDNQESQLILNRENLFDLKMFMLHYASTAENHEISSIPSIARNWAHVIEQWDKQLASTTVDKQDTDKAFEVFLEENESEAANWRGDIMTVSVDDLRSFWELRATSSPVVNQVVDKLECWEIRCRDYANDTLISYLHDIADEMKELRESLPAKAEPIKDSNDQLLHYKNRAITAELLHVDALKEIDELKAQADPIQQVIDWVNENKLNQHDLSRQSIILDHADFFEFIASLQHNKEG